MSTNRALWVSRRRENLYHIVSVVAPIKLFFFFTHLSPPPSTGSNLKINLPCLYSISQLYPVSFFKFSITLSARSLACELTQSLQIDLSDEGFKTHWIQVLTPNITSFHLSRALSLFILFVASNQIPPPNKFWRFLSSLFIIFS